MGYCWEGVSELMVGLVRLGSEGSGMTCVCMCTCGVCVYLEMFASVRVCECVGRIRECHFPCEA